MSLRSEGNKAIGESEQTTLRLTSQNAQAYIDLEDLYGAHNYHPLPVVIESGKGAELQDVDGNVYLDFLAGYSAANFGHCHPTIVSAVQAQTGCLTLTSRAFHHTLLGKTERELCRMFGYEKALLMNTGVEAVESALKLARRHAYDVRRTTLDRAVVIAIEGNFHGRTIAAISLSTDPESYAGFGPLVNGVVKVEFGDLEGLEACIVTQGAINVAAVLIEPIQGEAGVRLPPKGYLQGVRDICTRNGCLMIADEIQTGLGRTGMQLACDWEAVRPDMLLLGKALGGGILPVSCVLADNEVMLTIKPGQHGSTFGGNPLACSAVLASMNELRDGSIYRNSLEMGAVFKAHMEALQTMHPHFILEVRGRGLMNAVVVESGHAWELCVDLANGGVLAKPTHDNIIRFTPPLIITLPQIQRACAAIEKVVGAFVARLAETPAIEAKKH